jgi:Flp pilus assembly CpaF family ATPase
VSQFPQSEPFLDSPELNAFSCDQTEGEHVDPFSDGWGEAPAAGSAFAVTPESSYKEPVVTQELINEAPASEGQMTQQPVYEQSGQLPAESYTANVAVEYPTVITGPSIDEMEEALDRLDPETQAAVEALLARINDDDSSEVILNGPSEVLIKVKGQRYHDPAVTFKDVETYHMVINTFVLPFVDTRDRINSESVLIEGQMEVPSFEEGVPPTLARVHILCPPLTTFAKATIAKKARYEYDLDALAETGSMAPEMADFLKAVAHARLTFVVSGVTGSGKTTLLQAMSHYFDANDRIIVVEDTPELRLPIADVVYLNSSIVRPGEDHSKGVTIEWLVRQAQRMRMDRVVVGEVRGSEMYEFLLAANSGADGSATTVHADSPRRALDKMLALAAKGSGNTQEMTIRREIGATVDIVIQASLIDGRHVVTAVEEISATLTSQGLFSTQTLFRYDKNRGQHVIENAPSEDLRSLLQMRGVPVNPAWFPRQARF